MLSTSSSLVLAGAAAVLVSACSRTPRAPGIANTPPSVAATPAACRIVLRTVASNLGDGPDGSHCARASVSRAGVYVVGRAGEEKSAPIPGSAATLPVQRVRLHGPAPFTKTLESLTWVTAAANPNRPELILMGGYVRPFAGLGAEAPQTASFVLALDPLGNITWVRTAARRDVSPQTYENALVLGDDGSIAIASARRASVAALFGKPSGAPASAGEFLARLAAGGSPVRFAPRSAGEEITALAAFEQGGLYALVDGSAAPALQRLDRDHRVLWKHSLAAFSLGPLLAVPGHGALVGVHSVTGTSTDARLAEFDTDGNLLTQTNFMDADSSKLGHQALTGFATDAQGRVWVSGHTKTALTVGGLTLPAPAWQGQGFFAVLDRSGNPLALWGVPEGEAYAVASSAYGKSEVVLTRKLPSGTCELVTAHLQNADCTPVSGELSPPHPAETTDG